jgi:hypothetical protein
MLTGLLLASSLLAQAPEAYVLDLEGHLGDEAASQIQFAPPGCFEGLMVGALRPTPPKVLRPGEATVEVWDLALRDDPVQERQRLFLRSLQAHTAQALQFPPPSHGALDLAAFMTSNPARPQLLDLSRVRSLQDRFNRLPPNGSPVVAP